MQEQEWHVGDRAATRQGPGSVVQILELRPGGVTGHGSPMVKVAYLAGQPAALQERAYAWHLLEDLQPLPEEVEQRR